MSGTEEVVLSCEFWVLSCLSRAGAKETRGTKETRQTRETSGTGGTSGKGQKRVCLAYLLREPSAASGNGEKRVWLVYFVCLAGLIGLVAYTRKTKQTK